MRIPYWIASHCDDSPDSAQIIMRALGQLPRTSAVGWLTETNTPVVLVPWPPPSLTLLVLLPKFQPLMSSTLPLPSSSMLLFGISRVFTQILLTGVLRPGCVVRQPSSVLHHTMPVPSMFF